MTSAKDPKQASQALDQLKRDLAAWEEASEIRNGRKERCDAEDASRREASQASISDPDRCARTSDSQGFLVRDKGFDHGAAFKGLRSRKTTSKPTAQQPRIQEIITEEDLSAAEEHRQLGNVHFKEGRFDKAKQCYSECIGKNPSSYLGYANRAMADLRLGFAKPAEEDCTRAIELCPTYVKAWSRRGSARRELGNYAEAAGDFEHALRLEPNNKSMAKLRAECIMLHWQSAALGKGTDGEFRDIKITSDKGMAQHLAARALPRRIIASSESGNASDCFEPAQGAEHFTPNRHAAVDSAQAIARKRWMERLGNGSFRSFAEFESAWRSTQGDMQLEHAVLTGLRNVGSEQFFKDKMTPQLLYSIVTSVLCLDSDQDLVTLLGIISQTRRFSMNILFLTTQEKETLCASWHQRAAKCSQDARLRMDSLKDVYGIP